MILNSSPPLPRNANVLYFEQTAATRTLGLIDFFFPFLCYFLPVAEAVKAE